MMNILILCTANIRRSPMALGLLEEIITKRNLQIEAKSFGLAAFDGQAVDKKAAIVMEQIGIDISGHKALRVLKEDLLATDIIYVMTDSQKNIIADDIPEVEDKIKVLDIPDPVNGTIEEFAECRDEIKAYFEKEMEALNV